jgi:hypothetical protein
MKSTILAALLFASATTADAALQCDDDAGNAVLWRIGDSAEAFDSLGTVTSCMAWDNELAYIEQNFTGLRGRKGNPIGAPGPIVVYVGDDARFIVENLSHQRPYSSDSSSQPPR